MPFPIQEARRVLTQQIHWPLGGGSGPCSIDLLSSWLVWTASGVDSVSYCFE